MDNWIKRATLISILVIIGIFQGCGGKGGGQDKPAEKQESHIEVILEGSEIKYNEVNCSISKIITLAKEQQKSVVIYYDSTSEQITLDRLKYELKDDEIGFEEKAM